MSHEKKSRSPLTRSDVGSWMFKCNPADWDVEAAFHDGHRIERWRVRPSYRLNLIEAGDPAVLWVTGSGERGPAPGIWAVGYTTGELFEADGDSEYWVKNDVEPRVAVYVGVILWPIEVLTRQRVRADPRTAGIEILRQAQMSNPLYLSPDEYDALKSTIGRWPTFT